MSEEKSRLKSHLEDIDRLARLQQLRRELQEVAGLVVSSNGELPSGVEEAFLEYLLLVEKSPKTTYAKMLISDRVWLPPPDSLRNPYAVNRKLWEVIMGLSRRRIYLCNSNHLSDREMYALLWLQRLNEPAVDLAEQPGRACYLDLAGGDAPEDMQIYLRFYADEEERREWAQYLGETPMPSREKPPFDRDRFLPKHPPS